MLVHVMYDSPTASNHAQETELRNFVKASLSPLDGYDKLSTLSDISIYNTGWADNVPQTSLPVRKFVSLAVLGTPKSLAFNTVPFYRQYLEGMNKSDVNTIINTLKANKNRFRENTMSGAEFSKLFTTISGLMAKDIPILAWGGAFDIVNLICGGVNLPINHTNLKSYPNHANYIENRLMRLNRYNNPYAEMLLAQLTGNASHIPLMENCLVPYTRTNILSIPYSATCISYHEPYSITAPKVNTLDSFINDTRPDGLPENSIWYQAYLNITSKVNDVEDNYKAADLMNRLAHPAVVLYNNYKSGTPNVLAMNFNPLSIAANGKQAINAIMTQMLGNLE